MVNNTHAGDYMHEIKVSPEDRDLIDNHKWWKDKHSKSRTNELYYVSRVVQKNGARKKIILHRVIMERILGRTLNREEIVDHIDFNGLNNERSNLRICTSAENTRRRRMNQNNTSGFRGVVATKAGSWRAQICFDRRMTHIGTYASKEHADIAYDAVARVLFRDSYVHQ